ncbi:hypothetical protein HPP92_019700 [Vanilla planifolia]|uniref:Uncharacterized protein n=1 Tax=Vanilla planifolia TaxID=51239 RepID=A0A835ULD3_VANPL|nr:hypothetical protein HPP92_019700 [Vanilla planifolia]
MPDPDASPDLKRPPYTVENPIAPHLPHELRGVLRRQVNLARDHVYRLQPRFPPPLRKGLQRLRGDEAIGEEELDARVLEEEIDLAVGIGEVGQEGEIAVEVGRGVEVDAVEGRVGGVEGRVSRLDDEEDDEGDDSRGDEEEDESDAEEGDEPYEGVGALLGPEEGAGSWLPAAVRGVLR